MRLALADWWWRAVFEVVQFVLIRWRDWDIYGWDGRIYLDVAGRSLNASTLREMARHPEMYR